MNSTSKRLVAIGLSIQGAVLFGCGGSDCEEYCEEAKSCENADNDLAGQDCTELCEEAEDLADEAGCGDSFADFIDCALDGDICSGDIADECEADAFGYAFCVLDYCEENPNAEGCKGAVCTSSTTGSGTSCTVSRSCQGEASRSLTCSEGECTCAESEATVRTVPHDPAFCDGEHEDKVAAAQAACDWD